MAYGIETYDDVGATIFTTEDRIFRVFASQEVSGSAPSITDINIGPSDNVVVSNLLIIPLVTAEQKCAHTISSSPTSRVSGGDRLVTVKLSYNSTYTQISGVKYYYFPVENTLVHVIGGPS